MTRYARFVTPLGALFATAVGGTLTGLYFEGGRHAPSISPEWREDPYSSPLAECATQLADYFAGKRQCFDLPVASEGTPFQLDVWKEIARIPFGKTITYAELARRVGSPRAVRAAGAATGRNPLSIVVPCHRVVGSGGTLAGYAGGVDRKARLLALEATA